MSTISLVMIVKDEEEILEKCINSVKDVVDEFIIVDTGSTDGTKEIIKKYGELHEIPFTNFVETKNAALKLATCDYILFMDADEVAVAGLEKLKEYADNGVVCVSANIIEGPDDNENKITNAYLRARLWINNGEWEFHGPGVHEVIVGPGDITVDYEVKIRHEHLKKNKSTTSKERFEKYVEILEEAIKKDPEDTRAWFYLARTHRDLGNSIIAIDAYEKYLALPNLHFLDEEWQAAYDIALCWKTHGEYDKAFEACERAIKIDPRRAEAYNLKGHMYYNLQSWEKAQECYEKSLELPYPEDVSLFIDPTAYGAIPNDYVAIGYDRLRKYRKAEKALEEAIRQGTEYDHRIINNLVWIRGKTRQNIFMTLGRTPEDIYGGILNDRGVHGVETTYIELAHEFAKLGHSVFLFCTCEDEHKYEGVYYIPYTNIDDYASIIPDVVITSRWFDVLYRENVSTKIIWLQDALFKDPDRPDAFSIADAIVCSSNWHRQYIAERFVHSIDARKINVIPLGVRKDLFLQTVNRNPFKMIYSSNPDRGLYILINIWEELTEKLPLLELSICYGWEGLQTWGDSDEWREGVSKQKMEALQRLSSFTNINYMGRLTKKELAAEFLSSSLCLYPNNFWETFCLTALEAQAAGVPTITTDKGALATTLSEECNVLIRLDPYSTEYKEKFVQSTLDLINDSTKLELWSSRCRDFVYSRETDWEDIGKMWEQFIWNI